MPLYEYRCKDCEKTFSLLVGVSAEKPKQACPHCGSSRFTKLISRVARIVRSEDFADDFGGDDLDDMGDEYDDYDDFDD